MWIGNKEDPEGRCCILLLVYNCSCHLRKRMYEKELSLHNTMAWFDTSGQDTFQTIISFSHLSELQNGFGENPFPHSVLSWLSISRVHSFTFSLLFYTGSPVVQHDLTQHDLVLLTLLPPPLKCSDYRHIAPCFVFLN